MSERQAPQKKRAGAWWEWARTLLIAAIIALVLRTFVVTFVIVDGASMQDLLYTEDVMLVSRLHYLVGAPQRGDVAMCRYPGSEKNYVKRVIGLPGETIQCRDRIVYIDGRPLDESFLTKQNADDFGPVDIPEGHYFVMGDNRPKSSDSRAVGPLPESMLVGRALFVLWPLERLHVLPNHNLP